MSASSPSPSIKALLDHGAKRLQTAGIEPARREVEWILSHVTGATRLEFMMRGDRPVPAQEVALFESLLERRLASEPLQYLTGEAGFFGHIFRVTPAVLIPRPETEQLVEWALERIGEMNEVRVLDLGTGSGCIPISIQLARPGVRCTGLDVDESALVVARGNAEALGANVRWIEADMLTADLPALVSDPVHLLLSNPPYIADLERDTLQPEVVDHEPHLALFAGEDPLLFYRRLVSVAPSLLREGGWIGMEVHADHGQEVLALLDDAGWQESSIAKDLAGKDRLVTGRWNPAEATP